jgi:glutamate dehydrogenase (NADP+)
MGGGKGGSDFDPQGKSDAEVMRFAVIHDRIVQTHWATTRRSCWRYWSRSREIGYLFGQYKRIRNEFTGVLTGKGLAYGGSLIVDQKLQVTGVYFAEQMLNTIGQKLKEKTV